MSKNKYEKQKGSKQTDMKEMSKRFEKLSDNEKNVYCWSYCGAVNPGRKPSFCTWHHCIKKRG